MAGDRGERSGDWTDAGLGAQRAALEQWLGQGDNAAAEMLKAGTDRWWQLWAGQAGSGPRDAGDRLRSIGEQYLKGFRHVWTSLGGHAPDPTGAEFQQRLQKSLADLASGAAAQEFWSKLMPGFDAAAAPAGTLGWSNLVPEAATEPWKLLFSVPALGPAREHHAELTELRDALAAHQRLAAEFTSRLADVHRQAVALLARRVADRAQAGQPVDSFRSLYDEWVSCGEQVFADVACSSEYARLQGALGDSDARLRTRMRGLVERWCRSLDLPTRSELDTAHRRIRELSRRLEALERESQQSKRDGPSTTPSARGAARRSAAKKRPSSRSTAAGVPTDGSRDADT